MSMAIALLFDILILVWFGSKVEIVHIIVDTLSEYLKSISNGKAGSAPMKRQSEKRTNTDRMRAA